MICILSSIPEASGIEGVESGGIESRGRCEGLMDKRHPVYQTADIVVDSLPTDVEENARKTLQALAAWLERTDIAA